MRLLSGSKGAAVFDQAHWSQLIPTVFKQICLENTFDKRAYFPTFSCVFFSFSFEMPKISKRHRTLSCFKNTVIAKTIIESIFPGDITDAKNNYLDLTAPENILFKKNLYLYLKATRYLGPKIKNWNPKNYWNYCCVTAITKRFNKMPVCRELHFCEAAIFLTLAVFFQQIQFLLSLCRETVACCFVQI